MHNRSGGKKQGWALRFLHGLGIWHKAHFFLQMETHGVQGLNIVHDDLASYYAQAVTHEVLYEPFLIKVNYSPLTLYETLQFFTFSITENQKMQGFIKNQ